MERHFLTLGFADLLKTWTSSAYVVIRSDLYDTNNWITGEMRLSFLVQHFMDKSAPPLKFWNKDMNLIAVFQKYD